MSQHANGAAPVYGRAVFRGGEWTFDATALLAKGFSWGPFKDEASAVLDGAANSCCLGIELLHPELCKYKSAVGLRKKAAE